MYNLKDFVKYDGSKLSANHNVLIWSRATGYCFTQYSKVVDGQLIAAMED